MGTPYLVEAAFGYCPKNAPVRRIITGVNWSVAIGDPFRELDEDVSLGELLAEQRAGPKEPIVFVLHVVVDAFRHYARAPMIREAIERAIEEMPADAIAVPVILRNR